MIYSFCESIHAGSASPWHIRVIPAGESKKLGGGITTTSLCGIVPRGWDLALAFDEAHFTHTCTHCVNAFYGQLK